jgi:hypothetical protein
LPSSSFVVVSLSVRALWFLALVRGVLRRWNTMVLLLLLPVAGH